jgi:hypothetical protein
MDPFNFFHWGDCIPSRRVLTNGFLHLTLTGSMRHYGYVKSYMMHGDGFWRQDEWPGSPIVGLTRFFLFSVAAVCSVAMSLRGISTVGSTVRE